jgi:hypothetical protein
MRAKGSPARAEPGPVEHRDPSAPRPDHAVPFERLDRQGDARALRPQHQGQEFVGQRELVATEAVMGHQQPAREALLDGIGAVREGRLRQGHDDEMDVAQQHGAQARQGLERDAQARSLDAQPGSTGLDEDLVRGLVGSEERGRADHAFEAEAADLQATVPARRRDVRG